MHSEKRRFRSTPEDSCRSDKLTLPEIAKYARVNINLNPLCTQSCVCLGVNEELRYAYIC